MFLRYLLLFLAPASIALSIYRFIIRKGVLGERKEMLVMNSWDNSWKRRPDQEAWDGSSPYWCFHVYSTGIVCIFFLLQGHQIATNLVIQNMRNLLLVFWRPEAWIVHMTGLAPFRGSCFPYTSWHPVAHRSIPYWPFSHFTAARCLCPLVTFL